MYHIRKAEEKDSSIIMGFIRELSVFVKSQDQFIGTETQLKAGIFGENAVAKALILEENNIPVGYALYFYTYSTFLCRTGIFIEDIYISQKYRSKGYGKALFTYICNIAKEKGYGRVEWACLDWNETAIDFYLKLGAEKIAGKKIYRLSHPFIKKP